MPAVCLLPYSLTLSLVSSSLFLHSSSYSSSFGSFRCPSLFALSFLGANLSSFVRQALRGQLCAVCPLVTIHPANTLSVCLAALGSLDCTQTTLEIGLINIQYARITHSLVACSASRWASMIKWISLSLPLSSSLFLTLFISLSFSLSHSLSASLSISFPASFPLACSFQFVLH